MAAVRNPFFCCLPCSSTLRTCQLSWCAGLQVDPAGFEISGHLILKRQEDYDNVSQEWVWRLLSFASLSQAEFEDFVSLALNLD